MRIQRYVAFPSVTVHAAFSCCPLVPISHGSSEQTGVASRLADPIGTNVSAPSVHRALLDSLNMKLTTKLLYNSDEEDVEDIPPMVF